MPDPSSFEAFAGAKSDSSAHDSADHFSDTALLAARDYNKFNQVARLTPVGTGKAGKPELPLLELASSGAEQDSKDDRSYKTADAGSELRRTAVERFTSEQQWTGIAIDKDGQKFVNYPRWSEDTKVSVAKLDEKSGKVTPFPDQEWNSWQPGESGRDKFICVQSVVSDSANHLWALDTGHPDVPGMRGGAAKLLEFDPVSAHVLRQYEFPDNVAPDGSYLNDVRFDRDGKHAFMTDSNLGGLVILDLQSGKSRRVLAGDPSTKSEAPANLVIDGNTWLKDGKVHPVQSDGIAIDNEHGDLYYHAMTAHTLYRIPLSALLNESNDDQALAKQVKSVMKTGAPDGMEFGPDGYLYLTDLENNAIRRWKPGTEHKLTTVAQSPKIHWPDSMAFAPDGSLWFTTSEINLGPHPKQPYGIWRISASDLKQ